MVPLSARERETPSSLAGGLAFVRKTRYDEQTTGRQGTTVITVVITTTTIYTGEDREVEYFFSSEKEALAFLVGYINTIAEYAYGISIITRIEVR